MSGPKAYSFDLEAVARRERALSAARLRCTALQDRLRAGQVTLRALGSTADDQHLLDIAVTGADLTVLADLEQVLTRALDQTTEQIRERRRRAVRAHLLERVHAATSADSPARSSAGEGTERIAESLERCLSRVAGLDEGQQTLVELASRVSALVRAGDVPRADQALLALQTATERELRRQRSRDRLRTEVQALLLRTSDLTGTGAESLRARAGECNREAELTVLLQDEADLRRSHEAEQDRMYVIDQTTRALRDLGYEIGESFVVNAAAGHPTVARRADLPDHGLQLRFVRGKPQLLTNVVAYGETTPERDAEVENLTCTDLASLRQAWAQLGVQGTLTSHVAAGERSVQRLPKASQRPKMARTSSTRTTR